MDILKYSDANLRGIHISLNDCRDHVRKENFVYNELLAAHQRFVYIYSGSVALISESGSRVEAGENDILYIPDELHYVSRWKGEDKIHYYVIEFSIKDSSGNDITFGEQPFVLMHDRFASYRGIFLELVLKKYNKDPFFALECQSILLKLCRDLACDRLRDSSGDRYAGISAAVGYIENNFREDTDTGFLSEMSGMSLTNFRRLFKEYKGVTPVRYRNQLRIEYAAELLRTGKYNVTEAAEAAGFCDSKYFSKMFRRYAGMSPKSYKSC